MSISVMSGRRVRNFSMASSPLDASATSFISSSAFTRAAIPLRRRGWSSTVRIRIRLGVLIVISSPMETSEAGARQGRLIGCLSRNSHLNFGSGSHLTPDIQFCTYLLCSLSSAWKTPVSRASAFLQDLRIHTFSIVSHTQAELVLIVQNLNLDPARLCVPECISQDFACDAVDFILDDRI